MKTKQIDITGVTTDELRSSLELAFLFSCNNSYGEYNGINYWKIDSKNYPQRIYFQHSETDGYTPFPISMNVNDIYSIIMRFLKMDEKRKNDAYSKDGFTIITGVNEDDFDFYVEYSLVEDYFHESIKKKETKPVDDNPFVKDEPDGIDMKTTTKTSKNKKDETNNDQMNTIITTPPQEIEMPVFG